MSNIFEYHNFRFWNKFVNYARNRSRPQKIIKFSDKMRLWPKILNFWDHIDYIRRKWSLRILFGILCFETTFQISLVLILKVGFMSLSGRFFPESFKFVLTMAKWLYDKIWWFLIVSFLLTPRPQGFHYIEVELLINIFSKVGSKLSHIDLAIAEHVSTFETFVPGIFDGYPEVFCDNIRYSLFDKIKLD